ncbi:MAG: metallophosphoesterase [Nanoarchaeota archaeon]|nr:metallophosphoesterase [Nanoarchaeota archaeon]
MKTEILKFCISRGILLDKEVGEVLSEFSEDTAKEIIEKVIFLKGKILNKNFVCENVHNLRGIMPESGFERLCINLGVSIEISREIKPKIGEVVEEGVSKRNVKVLYSSSNLTKKIKVQDFTKYFRARYSELRKVLQERPELENLTSINKISSQKQGFSIIGIVYSKRMTKNKNLMLELEDLTGKISVLINQNKDDVYAMARDVMPDSVIGVRGSGTREMFFVNEIIFPEAIIWEKNHLDSEEFAAFTSDTHVGSKMFLEKNFLKFIEWINGNLGDSRQREEALKVKYLFITGDTIDGIGVYPNQDLLLSIKDIVGQYKKLAEYLSRIRNDVTIIMCPGQHDAVRVAEPQPVLGKEFAWPLHELDNIILVSNPSLVEIMNKNQRGIKILMYHGASMIHIINEVDSLRTIKAHDTPSKVVRVMLKNRHLCPIHSAVTYIPNEKRDELAIVDIPDIITTGDLHKPDVDIYNNILIICSSCWQSTTPFEEKVGNHPDPCKVPIVNLRTRAVKIIDFSEEKEIEETKTCEEKAETGEMICEVEK